jgi:hypothetical protein
MRKYNVKWKSCHTGTGNEICLESVFDDVKWDDMVARFTRDDIGETIIIPYTSIYDILLLDVDEGEDDQSNI